MKKIMVLLGVALMLYFLVASPAHAATPCMKISEVDHLAQ
jgi:hypothetical protein